MDKDINYAEPKLSENIDTYNQLAELVSDFNSNFSLTPVIGAELEFYLSPEVSIEKLEKAIGMKIKAERGANQYEIDLDPTSNLVKIAKDIDNIRKKITKSAKKLKGMADFLPKPFPNDFGSSLHIHINFLEDDDIEKYANILCSYTHKYLNYFFHKTSDLSRLDDRFMAPTRICWGGNNRTVMIRIPDMAPRRLEHRLAGSNSDPAKVIFAILHSIKRGLTYPNQVKKYDKIYGNAFDSQYELEKISEVYNSRYATNIS
ncbi:MAG: glutamine synthetase [Rickettsiales bacterium]|nr:glutamine synthetase [Rickettsiales bacterium]MCA0253919.1 glutamine synthetase [Pseudomonadota bacterium]